MKCQTLCVACGADSVRMLDGFDTLFRVTSDSRIWTSGGRLGQCAVCGLVQKPISNAYRTELAQLYDEYSLYFQGQGKEQKIFQNGVSAPRSELLTNCFHRQAPLISRLRNVKWLDLGCGRGDLLRTLSVQCPQWALFGADMSERNRTGVEAIPGVRGYFSRGLDCVHEQFDVLSMSHVLEHVPDPITFLRSVLSCLSDNGHLLIAAPNWRLNPFDLLVADHCLHFCLETLTSILQTAGFTVLFFSEDIIPKELVLIARPSIHSNMPEPSMTASLLSQDWSMLSDSLAWLSGMSAWAREQLRHPHVGILGTALAATWLDAACDSRFAFFVDEDSDRSGCTYMNRPVYSPAQVGSDMRVLVPLSPHIATGVCERLNRSGTAQYVTWQR